jgi:lysine-N-methylase
MPILHPTRTVPSLQPRYVSRFSCIGSSCEDNCCTDWKIGLDKKTYDAYANANPGKIANVVRINPEPRTDADYGHIVLTGEKKQCPLLEDNLCSIHRDQGEGDLSHTCFSYPRVWTELAGYGEQSLELSCPEAARLALLAPDAFEFEESSMTVRPEAVRTVLANPGFTAEAVNEVRYFCIKLMRTQELELWQRLAVLGLFCESLNEPVARQDGQAMVRQIEQFTNLLQDSALLDSLAPLQPDHAAQAMVFSLLWEGMPLAAQNTARRRVIDAVAAGLGANPVTGMVGDARLVERYREGLSRLPEALQAAPHLLEHYLLNELFKNLFPFDGLKPFDSYLRIVTRFGLLRLMLAARCHPSLPLPDAAALAQTVQVHARRFHHNLALIRRVDEALPSSGWARLDKLLTLLRT